MVAAVVLLLAGAGSFLLRFVPNLASDGITGEVLPELEPVERIEAKPGVLEGFNVLVITTDTTRADHIGAYGNKSIRTPVIDGLARDGILFANTATPSPSTLPAHSSLLTGMYPFHHGARANGTFKLEDEVTTLAERFKAKGYRTGAAISAFVLDSRFGLDQGFDLYHDDLTKGMKYAAHMFRERAAELTNEPVTEWLRENVGDEPFFFWVHYFDPHAVYLPPEPFRSAYRDDLYDGEIAYADSQIGLLLEELEKLKVRDKTLIVYTSDHGEGLGEHGEQTHSLLIYDATLRVPLVMSAPAKLPRGKVIHRQSSLVDVGSTVLSLLGEEVPVELDGIDWTRQPRDRPRGVVIETISSMTLHGWAPLIGLRRDDYKYIQAPTPELYDLRGDPGELENLHDSEAETVRELHRELSTRLGGDPFLAAVRSMQTASKEMDKETLRRLAALGYVHTTSSEVDEDASLPDPKEMIVHWENVQKGSHLQAQGRPKEAVEILKECLETAPRDLYARRILAGCYRQLGELDEAMKHLRTAEEQDPNDSSTQIAIAGVHTARREYEEARKRLAIAQQLEPESAQVSVQRGLIAEATNKPEEAFHHFRTAIEMDPGSTGPAANNQIGMLHLRLGQNDEAREAFQAAIKIDALNGPAHNGLANVLLKEDKPEEAMKELQIALRFDPNQPAALSTLASLISRQGDQERARLVAFRALEISPRMAQAHNNLGLIYRRDNQLEKAEEHYLKAIEEAPRLDAAYVNLAQLYSRKGDAEKAIEWFRKAVQANPRYPNPIALANLGVYNFNKGEPKAAFQLYRRALQLKPDYAMVHRYIASIYLLEDWNRPDLAIHHLSKSLEIEPDQTDAPQMRYALAQLQKAAGANKTAQ